MRGSEPYRQCWCRDPATGKPLRAKCPKLKNKKHGKWYARYDAGGTEGKRRQPVVGPFDTKKECEDELASALARIGGGGSAPDRKLRVAAYLDAYIAGKRNLKRSGGPGESHPRAPTESVRNSLPLHGSCCPGHLAGRFHPVPVGEVPRPVCGRV